MEVTRQDRVQNPTRTKPDLAALHILVRVGSCAYTGTLLKPPLF
jgi:hypothetical protein